MKSLPVNTLTEVDWTQIPAPEDDGGAQHLVGQPLPALSLAATDGADVDLSTLSGRTIVYAYPMTGRPDVALPDGWDMLPGARGCTPQSCSFRDHFTDLQALGAAQLFGLSTQSTAYQQEACERLHLPFALLSDENLALSNDLKLPLMDVEGMTLMKRLTMIVRDGKFETIFYPVFPPDRSAGDVIEWLTANPL